MSLSTLLLLVCNADQKVQTQLTKGGRGAILEDGDDDDAATTAMLTQVRDALCQLVLHTW